MGPTHSDIDNIPAILPNTEVGLPGTQPLSNYLTVADKKTDYCTYLRQTKNLFFFNSLQYTSGHWNTLINMMSIFYNT